MPEYNAASISNSLLAWSHCAKEFSCPEIPPDLTHIRINSPFDLACPVFSDRRTLCSQGSKFSTNLDEV